MEGLGKVTFARWSNVGVSDLPMATYAVKLVAAEPGVFDLHRLTLAQGRRLMDVDHRYQRRVAVLGAEVAAAFDGPVLGRRVRLGYAYFEVVGVLAPKHAGADLPIDPGQYNRAVLVPFDTALEELAAADAYKEIDVVSLEVASLEQTLAAKRTMGPVLRALHGGVEDFEIIAPEEILEKKRSTQAILNVVLTSIAAISLLVGGIGVMNIMLANIMERISSLDIDEGFRDDEVFNNFLSRYNLPAFSRDDIQTLLDAEHHDYAGSEEMVATIKGKLSTSALAELKKPEVGEPVRYL